MLGDLAFYAAVLGKPNMSSVWCTWCDLGSKEWREPKHNRGVPWTMERMSKVFEDTRENRIQNIPQNCKGIVNVPLFDSVELTNYIVSILHCEIGIGNKNQLNSPITLFLFFIVR